MSSKITLQQTDEFAVHYDEYVSQTHWYGPQMLFGLMYEYLCPEDNLLDLGIGTGISAKPFKRAGLKIYGVDGSEEMIKICQNKAITEDIRLADLADNFKSPYGVAIFEHVISVGCISPGWQSGIGFFRGGPVNSQRRNFRVYFS
jgi:predicted TPR repeat methyltransferase